MYIFRTDYFMNVFVCLSLLSKLDDFGLSVETRPFI